MRRRSGSCWTASTRGPWPGPCSGRARAAAGVAAGRPRPACAATVPGAPPSRQRRWPADRLRAVAVDGKTSRGARRADGTRVHLLGAAEHGGHLLDHLEVDVKHNETSHFTELLEPLDLAGAVVTFDALHTVRANLDWLVSGQERALHRDRRACFTLLLLSVMACQTVQPGRVRPGYGALCGVRG